MSATVAISQNAGELDAKFVNRLNQFKQQLSTLEKEIDRTAVPDGPDAVHDRLLEALEGSLETCREFEAAYGQDSELLSKAQAVFRRETDPWLGQSWFAHRARTKPSGFAGDYEMLLKIYSRRTPAVGLGAYLDRIFMELPLACGVRGRLQSARKFLIDEIQSRQGKTRVLDIASGPCREYLGWPDIRSSVEVVAMDNDPRALQYVREHVASSLAAPNLLRTERYNALRTRSAEATIRKFGRFDIVYSVGLCDYLTDDHLVRLLSAWRETLADHGVLYVAFKDTEQYDQTPYQWHLDWFFYQRTVQDVLNLYARAGFDLGSISTFRDSSGIITNFVTRREAGVIRRYDEPTAALAKPSLRIPHLLVPNDQPSTAARIASGVNVN